jgi:hypothetical protein
MHLLSVPRGQLPSQPAGFRPLTFAGRGLVLVGWVRYDSGPVGPYRELFAAVVGRYGRRVAPVVTHMWVDNPASRAGGRELWGYPKEMATIAVDTPGTRGPMIADARTEHGSLAHGSFQPRLVLPFRLTLAMSNAQPHEGSVQLVACTVTSRPALLGRAVFEAAEDGPLGYLRTGRRLFTVALRDFRATFGA